MPSTELPAARPGLPPHTQQPLFQAEDDVLIATEISALLADIFSFTSLPEGDALRGVERLVVMLDAATGRVRDAWARQYDRGGR